MVRKLDTTRPMSERHGKLRRDLIDPLADVWHAAYMEAASGGLLDHPSGPPVCDPRERAECAAAATLCTQSGMQGSFPAAWGGTQEGWRDTKFRWSAPRRAAVAVFYRALVLGLSPTAAMRAVSVARMRVRERLGIANMGRYSVRLAVVATPQELARSRCRREPRRLEQQLAYVQKSSWYRKGASSRYLAHLEKQEAELLAEVAAKRTELGMVSTPA